MWDIWGKAPFLQIPFHFASGCVCLCKIWLVEDCFYTIYSKKYVFLNL